MKDLIDKEEKVIITTEDKLKFQIKSPSKIG